MSLFTISLAACDSSQSMTEGPEGTGNLCSLSTSTDFYQELEGDLSDHLAGLINNIEYGYYDDGTPVVDNFFIQPDQDQLDQWRQIMDFFQNQDWCNVTNLLAEGNYPYQLIHFYDETSEHEVYILQEDQALPLGWGTFVFYPEGLADVILEAPHPIYDYNSEFIAIDMWEAADARFLMIAGAFRYTNGYFEDSSSDMARNPNTVFQVAHEVWSNENRPALSIHGYTANDEQYGDDIKESDIVLSDGLVGESPLVLSLKTALENEGYFVCVYDGNGACNELSGLVNVQLLYSIDRSPPFLFIHDENELDLRNNEEAWNPLASIFAQVIQEHETE